VQTAAMGQIPRSTERILVLVVTWPWSCLCDFTSRKLKFVYYLLLLLLLW